ncbi:MAG TPA: hypothetical protein VN704_07330 [Verrucomicrobiae bacterium]|nr:hypothetical protein [Verrucomicrobiae bacterium]
MFVVESVMTRILDEYVHSNSKISIHETIIKRVNSERKIIYSSMNGRII